MAKRARRRVGYPPEPPKLSLVPTQTAHPTPIVPPTPPLELAPEDRYTEFISGLGLSWLTEYVQTLPPWIDDATRDLGDDLYDRMANDATIRGNLHALKAGVLDEGLHLDAAVSDEHDPQYARAAEIRDFCAWVLKGMTPSIDVVLWDMLDALKNGHRLAEIVYAVKPYKGKPMTVISALKVKPRRSYAFNLDAYGGLVSVQALIPGLPYPIQTGSRIVDPASTPNLLGLHKVAILTMYMKEGDPRGNSLLRACYPAWWQKMQSWPEYLKFLTQFASPLITAILGAVTGPVSVGGKTMTAAENILTSLEQLRNGGVIVLPNGTTLDIKQSTGDGMPFLKAFEYHDQQITVAMMSQTATTGAHKANTRAAATVHQDVQTMLERQIKAVVALMVQEQLLQRLVEYNYGEQDAEDLTPRCSLGQEEQPDFAAVISALAPVQGFKLYTSQLTAVFKMLNLPAPDPEEVAADLKAQMAINNTVSSTGVPAAQSHNILAENRMSQGQHGATSVGSPPSGRHPDNAPGAAPKPTAAGAKSEGSAQ